MANMLAAAEPASTPCRDLKRLPKAELHLHLLAAMRPQTLTDFATGAGCAAPDPRGFRTFAEFQQVFPAVLNVCAASSQNLERLVYEMVIDAAADGTVWTQPQFNPFTFHRIGSAARVIDLVLEVGNDAGARHGVGFGLTLAASRHRGPQAAENLAHLAARYAGRGVYAFGLTGDESQIPAEPFAKAFAIAREAGLTAAPHAGELSGPQSVKAAVEVLGATRIAHGIRAVEDPDALNLLAEHGVSLDVCLTSNQLLGIVPDLTEHPLPSLLTAGVRCTLGTDDPLMFGVTLSAEYETARTSLGVSDDHLAQLARTSIETSDAPANLIARALTLIDNWLTHV